MVGQLHKINGKMSCRMSGISNHGPPPCAAAADGADAHGGADETLEEFPWSGTFEARTISLLYDLLHGLMLQQSDVPAGNNATVSNGRVEEVVQHTPASADKCVSETPPRCDS